MKVCLSSVSIVLEMILDWQRYESAELADSELQEVESLSRHPAEGKVLLHVMVDCGGHNSPVLGSGLLTECTLPGGEGELGHDQLELLLLIGSGSYQV